MSEKNEISPAKASPLPWIVTGVLVCLIIAGIVVIILLLSRGSPETPDVNPEETTREEADSDEEDQQTAEGDIDTETQTETPEEDNADTDQGGMYDYWPTYENSAWNFSLKYPKDLTYKETVSLSHLAEIFFRSNGHDVFTIWVSNASDLDSLLSNMLSNQCTDEVTYSNRNYGSNTFRKGLDNPNQTCLDTYGITRTYELAAFGKQLSTGQYWVFRNDGLNDEQLEAVLETVNFH